MCAVPVDSRCESVREIDFRRPIPLTAYLRTVNRVASVVPGTVLDELNEGLGFAEQFQHCAHDLEVRFFAPASNVVDLTRSPSFQGDAYRARVFVRKNPLTNIQTIAIDGQRSVFYRIGDQDWNKLFRELIWAVIVRTTCDYGGQPIRLKICLGKQIRCGFAGRVWAGGTQWRVFAERTCFVQAAIYLDRKSVV